LLQIEKLCGNVVIRIKVTVSNCEPSEQLGLNKAIGKEISAEESNRPNNRPGENPLGNKNLDTAF